MQKMLFVAIVGLLLTLTTATKLSGSWKDEVLEYHNEARRNLMDCQQRGYNNQLLPPPRDGYGLLQWSDTLAESANDWAKTCEVAEKGCGHWDEDNNYGECINCNSYAPQRMTSAILEGGIRNNMINAEVARYKHGRYGNDDKNCWKPRHKKNGKWVNAQWMSESSFHGNCGHYTQIIWGATTHVGCAYADCTDPKKITHVVCRYWPKGNVITQLPYEIGGTCAGEGNPVLETSAEDCVKISGMPNQNTKAAYSMSSLNGEWWRNSDGSFTKKGGINCGADDCRLAYSSKSGEFRVGFDWQLFGWCAKSNVRNCGGGEWKYQGKSGGEWKYLDTPTSVKVEFCADAGNPSPTPKPTGKPTNKPTPKPTAASSSCLEISGFTSVRTAHDERLDDLNGQWTQKSDGSWKKGSMKLSWTSAQRAWIVNGQPSHGYCLFSNIYSCDNEWNFIRMSGSKSKFTQGAWFSQCGALVSTDYPCYAKHARALTFSLNASHSLGFERVDVAGCHNDASQWYASSGNETTNSTVDYMLTAGNATNGDWKWLIHDTGFPYPKYVCNETELYSCGRGKWHAVLIHDYVEAPNATYNESANSYFIPTRENETQNDGGLDYVSEYDDGYSIENYIYNYDYGYYDLLFGDGTNETGESPGAAEADTEYVLMAEATLVPIVSAASATNSVFPVSAVVAVVAILLVIAVVVAGYFVLKRKRQRDALPKQMEVVPDDEQAIVTADHVTTDYVTTVN